MTSGRYGLVLREVGRLLSGGTVGSLGAGQLLERFAVDRDSAAFEALVTRHGPMVLGTCRRMLSDPHDVDDAFQATFLVLARKAGSIQDPNRLGPWLHGVARRVAARSRALSGRRKSFERHAVEEPADESPDLLEGLEIREALDEELCRLPEKYRAPLVLCYLEGLTHDEAAEALRWPVGTVRSRLSGGRDRLRTALTRRGLHPSAAVPALLPSGALSPTLLSTTVRVATSAGSPSAHVLTLAKGALIAMAWNKLKMVAVVGLMAGLTAGGAGVAAQKGEAGKAEAPAAEKSPTALEQFEAEMRRLRAAENETEKKIKELQSEHARVIAPLEKHLADLNNQEFDLTQAWKKRMADAASTTVNNRIKRLEDELQASRAETKDVRQKLDARTTEIARPVLEKFSARPDAPEKAELPPGAFGIGGGTAPSANPTAAEPKKAGFGGVGRRSPNPMVMQLGGSRVLIIPAEQDRATVLNIEDGTRATQRIPKGVTEVMPVISLGVVALQLKGPDVRQVAVYETQGAQWYPLDLKEPTTEAGPVVGNQEVTYQLGRFLYVFSAQAKKWSVLELKREMGRRGFHPMNGLQNGKMMIPEGDLIHLYDPKTGEWTHIDTKDDK
jgi:RNA polymerase sigma factor (sigma-70 family)